MWYCGVLCDSAVYCAVGRCTVRYGGVLCGRAEYCAVGPCTVR